MNWSDATFIPRNIYFINTAKGNNIAQNLPTIPQGENTVLGVHLAVREGKVKKLLSSPVIIPW